jgi:hypothetical protein
VALAVGAVKEPAVANFDGSEAVEMANPLAMLNDAVAKRLVRASLAPLSPRGNSRQCDNAPAAKSAAKTAHSNAARPLAPVFFLEPVVPLRHPVSMKSDQLVPPAAPLQTLRPPFSCQRSAYKAQLPRKTGYAPVHRLADNAVYFVTAGAAQTPFSTHPPNAICLNGCCLWVADYGWPEAGPLPTIIIVARGNPARRT